MGLTIITSSIWAELDTVVVQYDDNRATLSLSIPDSAINTHDAKFDKINSKNLILNVKSFIDRSEFDRLLVKNNGVTVDEKSNLVFEQDYVSSGNNGFHNIEFVLETENAEDVIVIPPLLPTAHGQENIVAMFSLPDKTFFVTLILDNSRCEEKICVDIDRNWHLEISILIFVGLVGIFIYLTKTRRILNQGSKENNNKEGGKNIPTYVILDEDTDKENILKRKEIEMMTIK